MLYSNITNPFKYLFYWQENSLDYINQQIVLLPGKQVHKVNNYKLV